MLICLCTVLLCVSILLFPLNFHVRGRIDLFSKEGIIAFNFFVLRVFNGHLEFEHEYSGQNALLIKSNRKNKTLTELHLTADKTDKNSIINFLTAPIIGSINITDIDLDVEVGHSGDALFTAMTLATIRGLYCSGMSVLKCWQHLRTDENFRAVYDQNIFKVEFLGIFTFNIADIMYGIVCNIKSRLLLRRTALRQKKLHE